MNSNNDQNFQQSRSPIWSYAIVLTSYTLAIILSFVFIQYLKDEGFSPLVYCAIANLASTFFLFIISLLCQNTGVFDLYWGAYPIVYILQWWNIFRNEESEYRQNYLLGAIMLFCIRHVTYFFQNWKGFDHLDFRYKQMKDKISNTVVFWIFNLFSFNLFPAFLLYGAYLPVYFIVQSVSVWNEYIYYFIVTLSYIAIIIEVVADNQLLEYRESKRGKFIEEGLWRFSRHPNYFGELLYWFSLYFTAILIDLENNWWTGIGFLVMWCMFQFASIPMMEERLIASRPGYLAYQSRVNRLFLWFPKEDTSRSEEIELINNPNLQ